jgi:hypothetical protein
MKKFIFLSLAILATFCLMLTGVAIGEGSIIGIISSLIGSFVFVGIGMRLKKNRE